MTIAVGDVSMPPGVPTPPAAAPGAAPSSPSPLRVDALPRREGPRALLELPLAAFPPAMGLCPSSSLSLRLTVASGARSAMDAEGEDVAPCAFMSDTVGDSGCWLKLDSGNDDAIGL